MALHRMSEAVEDLALVNDMQVRKSWWVSRAVVDEIRTENRKKTIITNDGRRIPVGRSFESTLRQAGWI
ncbi:MAG: LytTR family transcriptional regulator DNA-binding domain-containing protein [Paracoccaceae bacterium]